MAVLDPVSDGDVVGEVFGRYIDPTMGEAGVGTALTTVMQVRMTRHEGYIIKYDGVCVQFNGKYNWKR